MIRTAVTKRPPNKKDNCVYFPAANKYSQRYSYMAKTFVLEDEDNPGKLYDFIPVEEYEERVFAPDNEKILDILEFETECGFCIRMEENGRTPDGKKTYIIHSILNSSPGLSCLATIDYYTKKSRERGSDKQQEMTNAISLAITLRDLYNMRAKVRETCKLFPDLNLVSASIGMDVCYTFKSIRDRAPIDFLKDNLDKRIWDASPLEVAVASVDANDIILEDMVKSLSSEVLDYLKIASLFWQNSEYVFGNHGHRHKAKGERFFEKFVKPNPLAYRGVRMDLNEAINSFLTSEI